MVIPPRKGLSSFLLLLIEFPRQCGIPHRRLSSPYLLQSCTCRRAMVNKIWCRKVARTWLQAKPVHPRVFSEPICQNYVGLWYLTYRCLNLLAWLTIIVCSIFEVGSAEPLGNIDKWLIYLTNWDLCLGALQAALGLTIVAKRWKLQKLDFEPQNITLGKLEKVYWFLYCCVCTLAVGVTVSYWVAVHDPKIHAVDALNIMLHVCNSVLMIFDICITGIPLRLRDFWWPLTIITPYIIFSYVYYAAGGVDKKGLRYIYKLMDWGRPSITVPMCIGGMVFLVVVHCLLCLMKSLRDRFYSPNGEKYVPESPSNSTSERSSQTFKQALQIV